MHKLTKQFIILSVILVICYVALGFYFISKTSKHVSPQYQGYQGFYKAPIRSFDISYKGGVN